MKASDWGGGDLERIPSSLPILFTGLWLVALTSSNALLSIGGKFSLFNTDSSKALETYSNPGQKVT